MKLERYKKEFDIPRYDAEIITGSKHMADIFEAVAAVCGKPKKAANWLIVETLRLLKERGQEPEDICFDPENLAKLIAMTEAGVINSSVAKTSCRKKNWMPSKRNTIREICPEKKRWRCWESL